MRKEEVIKKQDLKEVGNKVWIDRDRIVNIRIAKVITEKDAHELIEASEKLLKEFQGKGKVLINIIPYKGPFIATSEFRKRIAEKIKRVIGDPGFEKVAIIGGDVIIRTVSSFIIMASGTKEMKVFDSQKQALKWLKK